MSATGSPNSPARARALPPPQRITLGSGLVLDSRRAVFLPAFSVLAVADLHLGYAWVQRTRGLLLPVSTPDRTPERLAELVADHAPKTVALLGDLVHRAVAVPGMESALRELCDALSGTELVLCPGNHDHRIGPLLTEWRLPVRLSPGLRLGPFHLHHGDDPVPADPRAGFQLDGECPVSITGHEHPAIELDDGAATRARVPCFLVSENAVVLLAFSDWAAGSVLGRDSFLGTTAQGAWFHTAYACLGPRLLPLPLDRHHRPRRPGVKSQNPPRGPAAQRAGD